MGIDIDSIVTIEETKITSRGFRHRTTIPKGAYKHLDLKDKDTLRWILLKDGTLIIKKVNDSFYGFSPK